MLHPQTKPMLRTVILLAAAVALGHAIQLFECAPSSAGRALGQQWPDGVKEPGASPTVDASPRPVDGLRPGRTSGTATAADDLWGPHAASCEPVRSFSGLFVERFVDTLGTGASLGADAAQALWESPVLYVAHVPALSPLVGLAKCAVCVAMATLALWFIAAYVALAPTLAIFVDGLLVVGLVLRALCRYALPQGAAAGAGMPVGPVAAWLTPSVTLRLLPLVLIALAWALHWSVIGVAAGARRLLGPPAQGVQRVACDQQRWLPAGAESPDSPPAGVALGAARSPSPCSSNPTPWTQPMCRVCHVQEANCTLVHKEHKGATGSSNTGHLCCCRQCAQDLEQNQGPCPVCQQPVLRTLVTFTS